MDHSLGERSDAYCVFHSRCHSVSLSFNLSVIRNLNYNLIGESYNLCIAVMRFILCPYVKGINVVQDLKQIVKQWMDTMFHSYDKSVPSYRI